MSYVISRFIYYHVMFYRIVYKNLRNTKNNKI